MLIIMMLIPMIIITLISIVFGADFLGVSVNVDYLIDQMKNGTVKELLIEQGILQGSHTFNITLLGGAIAIIMVVGIIALGLGIQVLGSGLSETSVKTLVGGVAYTGIWLVLSVLSAPLILNIETFGTIIYIILTIGYVLGVVQKLT